MKAFKAFSKWFIFTLTLSFLVPRWAGDNTNLPSKSNISKTIRVNIAFTRTFFKEYSISFLMVCKLIVISKIDFFNFSVTERVKNLIRKEWPEHCQSHLLWCDRMFRRGRWLYISGVSFAINRYMFTRLYYYKNVS